MTPEEKEAISAILDYDNLAERYNPNLSDPVKATYNTDAGTDELLAYFRGLVPDAASASGYLCAGNHE